VNDYSFIWMIIMSTDAELEEYYVKNHKERSILLSACIFSSTICTKGGDWMFYKGYRLPTTYSRLVFAWTNCIFDCGSPSPPSL